METVQLPSDPYNVIITGVGGQGNVMASRILGNMMARRGLEVTIGETFGASQRGGAVMSHLRISSRPDWSPQIPRASAHVVVALEPIEALRVLKNYGSPTSKAICNTRPIQPVGVISGEVTYPPAAALQQWITELTAAAWFVDATAAALRLGNPILGNILMIGALAGIGGLPMERGDFEAVIAGSMPADKVATNLKAYDLGIEMIRS